jgi:hypothetical protein
MAYLRATPDKVPIYEAILAAGVKHIDGLARRQAQMIAAEVSKLFKK